MAAKKHTSLDRVLGRLDSLDAVSLTNLVQRLARERALLEEIFNTLQEGVLVIAADGTIEYANDAAHRLMGSGGDRLAGQALWRLVPGLRASLEGGGAPAVSREFELSYPEPRTIRFYMVGLREEEGGPRRRAVILADVTRERQATDRRIEDERTSSILLLAAGVAHELGNPLNSLAIHLQLVARRLKRIKDSAQAESLAQSVAVCREEVGRLDGIVTHFLEAVRPRPPDLAETDVADVLAEVLKFQKREFANRGIAVEAQKPAALPAIMADRGQLKQVFFNLTKNAMEAMQPGGRLRIRSHADDGSVYVVFGDSGAGISAEDMGKLFRPYHTTKPGGHGLGLTIVQRIMRAHGGQVGVESREGIGTVVTLQFPRKDRSLRMLRG